MSIPWDKRLYIGWVARALVLAFVTLYSAAPTLAADMSGDGGTHVGPNGSQKPLDPNKPDTTANSCNSQGSPVYLKDLTFVWSDVDIALNGRPALYLSRFYNSFDGREGIFGKGWTASCERSLVKVFGLKEVGVDAATGAVLSQEQLQYVYRGTDGRSYSFVEDANGKYQPPAGLTDVSIDERADQVAAALCGAIAKPDPNRQDDRTNRRRHVKRIAHFVEDGFFDEMDSTDDQQSDGRPQQ